MGDIDLQSALQMFTAGVKDLQVARTISGANQAVDQIRNSELKDEEKNNQLRNVAQQLTFGLAAQGVPGTTIQAVAGFAPPKNDVSSPFGRFVNGTPEQRQQVRDYEQSQTDQKIAIEKAGMEKALAVQGLKNQGTVAQKAAPTALSAVKEQTRRDNNLKDLNNKTQPDATANNAFGAAAKSVSQAERILALTGNNPTDDKLNEIAPQFVTEVAAALSRQVLNGTIGEETLRRFVPHDIKLDAANLEQYLTSKATPANQASMLRLYVQSAKRERNVAKNQIEDSILKRATGLPAFNDDPEAAKTIVAKKLDVPPEDVIIKDKNNVTTVQRQEQEDRGNDVLKATRKLKLQLADPKKAADAGMKLKALGFSPDMSDNEIQQEINARIKAKEFPHTGVQ